MKASARVMRSFDYCHFEVALEDEVDGIDGANELRKQAAVLVDEAVRQFKIAKRKEANRELRESNIIRSLESIAYIKTVPMSEWTIEQAALMRVYEDKSFWKNFDEDAYAYWEDPDRDHHFSMLNRFKETRISAATPMKTEEK